MVESHDAETVDFFTGKTQEYHNESIMTYLKKFMTLKQIKFRVLNYMDPALFQKLRKKFHLPWQKPKIVQFQIEEDDERKV